MSVFFYFRDWRAVGSFEVSTLESHKDIFTDKASQNCLYWSSTGYKSNVIFTVRFCIFAYMQIKKALRVHHSVRLSTCSFYHRTRFKFRRMVPLNYGIPQFQLCFSTSLHISLQALLILWFHCSKILPLPSFFLPTKFFFFYSLVYKDAWFTPASVTLFIYFVFTHLLGVG